MPRKQSQPNINTILASAQPLISMLILTTGLVVWAFNTFAQISYVKEQNTQLQTLIEQRHNDAITHSDMNRERVLALLNEIKESVKEVQFRTSRR